MNTNDDDDDDNATILQRPVGRRLEMRGDGDEPRFFLAGRPVVEGAMLDLYVRGRVGVPNLDGSPDWLRVRFEWSDVGEVRPKLMSAAHEGEEMEIELRDDDRFRWPSS